MNRAWIFSLALMSCGGQAEPGATTEPAPVQAWEPEEEMADEDFGYAADAEGGGPAAKMGRLQPAPRGSAAATTGAPAPPPAPPSDDAANNTAARSWFPETFLWMPRAQTDASGSLTVSATVPDTLTTWRVLSLAHTKAGRQAGAVHTFDSRLPAYADPVVPAWLYTGDQVELPVQAVNTSGAPLAVALTVSGEAALRGSGGGAVRLADGESLVRRVALSATQPGMGLVSARLGDIDTATRQVPVRPRGKAVITEASGWVTRSVPLAVEATDGADPATEQLQVHVYPGPLALLAGELERAGTGASTPWADAYGFALATHLRHLAAQTGAEVQAPALRTLEITSWQRLVRRTRSPDAALAADVLAALDGTEHGLAKATVPRLVDVLVAGQRADGTWSRNSSATLQQVIAETAWAARQLPDNAYAARTKASAALERFAGQVEDPYTAAVMLSSGLVQASLRPPLLDTVRQGLTEDPHTGARTATVAADAVDIWGRRPSVAQQLAFSTLALPVDDPVRGELIAELMGRYRVRTGFGAGPADVVALQAVAGAAAGLSEPVQVKLLDGDEVLAEATLDPAQPYVPAVLDGAPSGALTLALSREVPGLAWSATRRGWIVWSRAEQPLEGVDVEIRASGLVAGKPGLLEVTVAAPKAVAVALSIGIPAGLELGNLVQDGLRSASTAGDVMVLETTPLGAGELRTFRFTALPAFAGSFSAPPVRIEAAGRRGVLAPVRWTVR